MSAREWFPFFYDAFWEDENVVGMTESAALLYLFLLSRQWKHGSLPADPEKIRRLCPRWELEWKAVWREVEPRFPICSSGCSSTEPEKARRRNPRMKVEQDVEAEILEKLRENGKKGGLAAQARARAKARLDQGSTKAQASDLTPTLPNPTDKKEAPPARRAPRAGISSGFEKILPEYPDLDSEAVRASLAEWVGYRRSAKLPAWVDPTWRKALGKAVAWGPDGLVASVNASVSNGWRGLFEPSASGNGSPRGLSQDEAFEAAVREHRRKNGTVETL